jgi:hypothetical protein
MPYIIPYMAPYNRSADKPIRRIRRLPLFPGVAHFDHGSAGVGAGA